MKDDFLKKCAPKIRKNAASKFRYINYLFLKRVQKFKWARKVLVKELVLCERHWLFPVLRALKKPVKTACLEETISPFYANLERFLHLHGFGRRGDRPKAWSFKNVMSSFLSECIFLSIFSAGVGCSDSSLRWCQQSHFSAALILRSRLFFSGGFLLFSAYHLIRTHACPAKPMQLEMIWFSVAALLWCAVCFLMTCDCLINHIDRPVSRAEGRPPLLCDAWPMTGD